MASFFESSKDAIQRSMQKVLFRKQYDMNQISVLQSYFSKLIETSTENGRIMLREMKENAYSNPWFRKSAFILSLNTRLNVQKSFWRILEHTDPSDDTESIMMTSGQPHFFSTESMPISLATSRNESEKSIIYQHD